jgi:hypothetical protein
LLLLFSGTICRGAEPWLKALDPNSAGTNLLRNSQFEQYQGSQFTGWQSAPEGFKVAPGEGRTASTAVKCIATNTSGWRGVSQTLNLNRSEPRPFVVRGWSRAVDVSGSPDSNYSLYVDIIYTDGTPLWGQTARFDTGTHDWEQSEVLILPEKPVRSVSIHCILRGHSGTVWFDDVEVREIVAPSGGVIFQGAPMQLLTPPAPVGTNRTLTTGDGLKLDLAGDRVTEVRVDDVALTGTGFGGFFARDVAAGSDVFGFTNGLCLSWACAWIYRWIQRLDISLSPAG